MPDPDQSPPPPESRRPRGRPPTGDEPYVVTVTARLTRTQGEALYQRWRASGGRGKFAVWLREEIVRGGGVAPTSAPSS